MPKRDELINFIEDSLGREFIANAKRRDGYVNGPQILGAAGVKKVALGVSVSLEFLKRCRAAGANFIVVHHGIGMGDLDHFINPVLKERFRALINGEMTLLAYHYVLDAHPQLGNNAQIMQRLGARIDAPFYDGWGFSGEFEKALPLDAVIKQLTKIMGAKPVVYRNGDKLVKKVAVVSGGAAPKLSKMGLFTDGAVDLYITGETGEPVPELTKEAGINYAACGHYNSEKFGVVALGQLIKKKYPALDVEFVDIPCDL